MRSSNPVLSREGSFSDPSRGGYAPAGRSVTLDDVVVRSSIMLGTLTLTGAAAWLLDVPLGIAMVAAIAALVIGLVASFKRTTNPALFMAYAVLEGVVIGAVSHLYESAYNGIVVQAVLGVVIVFGVMLTLYKTGVVRVTNRFVTVLTAAALAFVGLMLLNLVAGLFVDGGLGLRDGGPLAIGFAAVGVLIGAFFYALDFKQVEELVASGAPEKESWRAAFGLTLTTVWVYMELLRLISYFRD